MLHQTHPRSRFRSDMIWGLLAAAFGSIFFIPYLTRPFGASHDMARYPYIVIGLCHAMAEGRWDGRWLCDFAMGYGNPIFNFYPPGFCYLAALFHTLGLSAAGGCQAATAIFSLIGTIGAYGFGRMLWRSAPAGFITAILWTFFPYRILDLYVRGDHSELAAMSLMTWVLAGHLWVIRGGGRRAIALAAAAHAGIFWTHVISSMLFMAYLIVFDLLFIFVERRPFRRAAPGLAAAIGLALGLGAAAWMPAFFERSMFHFKSIIGPGTMFRVTDHLLYFKQLFKSGWGWGMSLPGPDDGMSFQLGRATLAGIVLGLAGIVWNAFRSPHSAFRIPHSAFLRAWLALALLGSGVLFFTLQQSSFFWAHVQLAEFVQFPWRLLMLATLTLPMLAGPAAAQIGGRGTGRRGRGALTPAVLLGLAGGVAWMVFPWCHSIRDLPVKDAEIEQKIRTDYVITGLNDYLPRDVPFFELYDKNWKMNRPFDTWPKAGTLAAVAGKAEITPEGSPIHNVQRAFRVRNPVKATVEWRHFYFPGWYGLVDRKSAVVHPSAEGRILLDLAPGDHQVEFRFGDTPLRRAAKIISVLSAMLLLGMVIRPKRGSAFAVARA